MPGPRAEMHATIELIDRIAAHFSTGQIAMAGGAGSATAIAAAMAVDPNWAAWLQITTYAVGILSGLAGLTLVVMKMVQQRREMRAWAKERGL